MWQLSISSRSSRSPQIFGVVFQGPGLVRLVAQQLAAKVVQQAAVATT